MKVNGGYAVWKVMGFQQDKNKTLKNRELLLGNNNLLFWYKKLFEGQLEGINTNRVKVLEIGSGTSPIKLFYKNILTSDIIDVDYVDYVFDCQNIDAVNDIHDESVDCIVFTNVLHHVENPILFFIKSAKKLKRGGQIIATEPYFSILSSIVYRYIHHEEVDFTIHIPKLNNVVAGPLSSSNIALPYLIFFKRDSWLNNLKNIYDISMPKYYTSLAYFLTGGISRKIPCAPWLYKIIFLCDKFLSNLLPRVFTSFFTVRLTKK